MSLYNTYHQESLLSRLLAGWVDVRIYWPLGSSFLGSAFLSSVIDVHQFAEILPERACELCNFSSVALRLGQKDEAFAWFEKTFEARDPSTLQFKIEPAYDSLHSDPRYAKLISKIGLQP